MRARRGSGLARLLFIGGVVVLLAVAWIARAPLQELWARATGASTAVSPELAALAEEKLNALGQPGGSDRVALVESELQSLLVYRWGSFLPEDVVNPRLELAEDRVTLEGGVATARFGQVAELRDIVRFLPDTTELRAVASFVPVDSGAVALQIHELGAAGIPVPDRLIPTVLRRFRGSPAPGVGPNSITVPLPAGIRSVYLSQDSMIFVANPLASG